MEAPIMTISGRYHRATRKIYFTDPLLQGSTEMMLNANSALPNTRQVHRLHSSVVVIMYSSSVTS